MSNKKITILVYVGFILFPWLVLGLIFDWDILAFPPLDGLIVFSIFLGLFLVLRKYEWASIFLGAVQYIVAFSFWLIFFMTRSCAGGNCGWADLAYLLSGCLLFSILLVVMVGVGIIIDHRQLKLKQGEFQNEEKK